jgi:hypothetical protein
MTFEKVVDIYTIYLKRVGKDIDARTSILDFLGWEGPDEDGFAQDVCIVLASAEFSEELTTAVMWLNDHGLDIRCVRMRPYDDNGRLLVDVQQVIPLPEAADYQVQVREKEKRGRQERAGRYGIRMKFWQELLARAAPKTSLHANISPTDADFIGTRSAMGGVSFNYVIGQYKGRVELSIARGREEAEGNKQIFDRFQKNKEEIEKAFGGVLSWQRLDDKQSCRIAYPITLGGWRSDESKWPEVQDAMIDGMVRLEKALKPQIASLKTEFAGEQA